MDVRHRVPSAASVGGYALSELLESLDSGYNRRRPDCFTRKSTTTAWMSATGSHLRHLLGGMPCLGFWSPWIAVTTAADQTASPGNQLRRHGCPPPGPICGICWGVCPVWASGVPG